MVELTGLLKYSVSFTATGKPILTFEINEREPAIDAVDKLHDQNVSIKICKSTKKRSLDANAYYWLLIGKLSKALKISTSHCHNLMLRRYGVFEEYDGQLVYLMIPDTEEASTKADEAEEYHIKPTSNTRQGKDGVMYRTYMLLKGSHDYTKEEFCHLVDGLVDECKHMGIPTATPDEIWRMKSLLEVK